MGLAACLFKGSVSKYIYVILKDTVSSFSIVFSLLCECKLYLQKIKKKKFTLPNSYSDRTSQIFIVFVHLNLEFALCMLNK